VVAPHGLRKIRAGPDAPRLSPAETRERTAVEFFHKLSGNDTQVHASHDTLGTVEQPAPPTPSPEAVIVHRSLHAMLAR
jgi:hypothetical protein